MLQALTSLASCAIVLLHLFPQVQSVTPTNFTCTSTGGGSNTTYSAKITSLGCYSDNTTRTLSGKQINPGALNTPQYCADSCGILGYKYAGAEYGTQCFCGDAINPTGTKADNSSCNMNCPADPSAPCGGTWFMDLYEISNPEPNVVKNSFTPYCYTNPLCGNKACDKSLSISERIAALLSQMTLTEKIANTVDSASGVLRLGLPPYEWWSEALHGVASSPGVTFNTPNGSDFSYATSFPMPILMSAAFDDLLINKVASVVGKEARAFGNYGFAGFDFWTPNINPFRDPRWGRGLETPGEDAFHIQRYIYQLIPGLQWGASSLGDVNHKQVIATCKHYAAYDIEQGRNGNDYNPTQQDLGEYFLQPFKACVRDAKVGSIMCSYNAVDGIPSCASEYLLQTVLREHWGSSFTHDFNYVTSDCDAIGNIYDGHNFTDSYAAASAVALNAGTDLDCGTTYITLNESIANNWTTVETLDRSLTRLYNALFTIGAFDGESPYDALNWDDVSIGSAQTLAYEAAVEGMTLLKNDGLLPLKKSYKKVALIGPWANATTQMQGNYQGTAPYLKSPLEAFQSKFDSVTYELGTAINASNTTGFSNALSAAKSADLIVYLGGIDTSIEAEGLDRPSIVWPEFQLSLISELSKTGKPLAVVQFGAGQIDDTSLLSNKNVNALLWAGYPGQDGGYALLDVLTGAKSVAGRLPVTQYPASYADETSIFDLHMRPNGSYPGRTYKWYDGKPIFPFGYGLHYTNFAFSWASGPKKSYDIESLVKGYGSYNDASPWISVSVDVKNTGGKANMASDYVGLIFISTKNAGPKPYPNKSLVGYARAKDIPVHGSQKLTIQLALGALARANEDGDLVIYPGDYELTLDTDAKLTFKFSLTGKELAVDKLPPQAPHYSFTVPVHLQPPSTSA
ncbi:glycoside hydrolase [Rhizodiscina lignyota]|uniref:xylan 1,4-beta-xylosidase n=1 Tax=Rhizodiscina lignyota TaxID=1504668 RepID=A0A9P4IM94_9PEZI|nr:glycoside hydrolase [Rhizodiscina lignyota]